MPSPSAPVSPQQQPPSAIPPTQLPINAIRTLDSVRASLDKIEWGLPILRGQIQSHLARIAFFPMANRHGHSYNSPTLNPNKLWLSHKSLRYSAALVDEQTMQVIFHLDSLHADHEYVRRQVVNALIAQPNNRLTSSGTSVMSSTCTHIGGACSSTDVATSTATRHCFFAETVGAPLKLMCDYTRSWAMSTMRD